MYALNERGYDTLAEARIAAEEHTLATLRSWQAYDAGPNVSPRFYMARQPAIGDMVSMAFNGDSYPCGTITKLSATKAVTSDGHVFKKPRNRPIWREGSTTGTFRMIFDHHNERNPCF